MSAPAPNFDASKSVSRMRLFVACFGAGKFCHGQDQTERLLTIVEARVVLARRFEFTCCHCKFVMRYARVCVPLGFGLASINGVDWWFSCRFSFIVFYVCS